MGKQKKELLIIIPAYNEEKTIGIFLDKLKMTGILERADILVMNDASQDNTRGIVKDSGNSVVTGIYHLGYGCGLQMGYRYAQMGGYKYVIQMDADGQHDASNVERILKCLQTPGEGGKYPDIVLGSRFMDESISYEIGLSKKIAYALFRKVIKMVTGREISDPTTGLQGLSSRAFSFYSGYGHFVESYPDANMLIQMLLLGFRVKEIPAVMHAREEGSSMHSGLKPVGYMFLMMFSIIGIWIRIKVFHVDVEETSEKDI